MAHKTDACVQFTALALAYSQKLLFANYKSNIVAINTVIVNVFCFAEENVFVT